MDEFEWDARKAAVNRRKHGIDFADATAVFEDERALTVPDEITAVDEIRMLTLGRDTMGRVVVVAYTWRGDRIRLISARRRDSRRTSAVPEGRTMKAQRRGVDFSVGRRGAVLQPAKGKTRITIRLDTELLDWFREEVDRAGGGNYQTLINEALRQHVEGKQRTSRTRCDVCCARSSQGREARAGRRWEWGGTRFHVSGERRWS